MLDPRVFGRFFGLCAGVDHHAVVDSRVGVEAHVGIDSVMGVDRHAVVEALFEIGRFKHGGSRHEIEDILLVVVVDKAPIHLHAAEAVVLLDIARRGARIGETAHADKRHVFERVGRTAVGGRRHVEIRPAHLGDVLEDIDVFAGRGLGVGRVFLAFLIGRICLRLVSGGRAGSVFAVLAVGLGP